MTQTLEQMLQAELANPQYIVNDALLKNMVENLPVEIQQTAGSFEETLDEIPPMVIPPYLIDDPELVGYPDEEFQQMIYRNVAKYLIGCDSVKDFGCGRGDFSLMVPRMKYIGIDKSPVMQKIAAVKYPDLDFRCVDWSQPLNIEKVASTFKDLFAGFEFEVTDASVMIGSLMDDAPSRWDTLSDLITVMEGNTTKVCVLVLADDVYPLADTFQFLRQSVVNVHGGRPFTLDVSFANGIYAFVWWKDGFK